MKNTKLLSTVAATLLLAVGAASAQDVKKDEAPARAPAAQQNGPAEKVAPAMKPGAHNAGGQKAPETTGQAPEGDRTKASDKGAMDKGAMENKKDKAPEGDRTKASDKGITDKGATDKGAMDNKKANGAAAKGSSDANGSGDVKAKTNESTAQGAPGAKSSQSSTSEKDRATTGQGAAGSAKLSTEQSTKITTIIRQQKVAPAHLNVSIRVGNRVPESVRFYPLPAQVFAIYPEWRGYDYILVGNQILVINPRTHEIVAILDA
jgi:Protein of unknown function (DUF1236)